METVEVLKLNLAGQVTWRYTGTVLESCPVAIKLEALFNRPDTAFHGILLGQGDRFIEIFYNDRMYNIFEIHDRDGDQLKGWYCNICRPAEFRPGEIAYVDLSLDLLVYPDGRQLVLDEDEFAVQALELSQEEIKEARAALRALQDLFSRPGGFSLNL
jgi:uncharacterized protein